MTFNLTPEEIDILKQLTPYPKMFGEEVDYELDYLASLKLAARHHNGWTKGANTDHALRWLKSLAPPRIKTCKGCNQ